MKVPYFLQMSTYPISKTHTGPYKDKHLSTRRACDADSSFLHPNSFFLCLQPSLEETSGTASALCVCVFVCVFVCYTVNELLCVYVYYSVCVCRPYLIIMHCGWVCVCNWVHVYVDIHATLGFLFVYACRWEDTF